MRWTRIALACIQEACEDLMVELFQDAYICAAHAHRVTLMDKDMITLRRLRYRFSNMLEPLPMHDLKAYNILNIPPWRTPKEPKLGVVDVTEEEERKARRIQDKEDLEFAEREELNLIEPQLVPLSTIKVQQLQLCSALFPALALPGFFWHFTCKAARPLSAISRRAYYYDDDDDDDDANNRTSSDKYSFDTQGLFLVSMMGSSSQNVLGRSKKAESRRNLFETTSIFPSTSFPIFTPSIITARHSIMLM
ncbi:hypothetical protein L7F22_058125 [Adiantum nelumboides]|nr:hypothetical protein [Adiantum nelumboides]